jgi:hypothetical protein
VPALTNLLTNGSIRINDLAVVSKDRHGKVTIVESGGLQQNVGEALLKLDGELSGLLSEDDLMMAAMELEHDSDGAAMLFENGWAAHLAEAIRNAQGEVLVHVRIPNHAGRAARQSILDVLPYT